MKYLIDQNGKIVEYEEFDSFKLGSALIDEGIEEFEIEKKHGKIILKIDTPLTVTKINNIKEKIKKND